MYGRQPTLCSTGGDQADQGVSKEQIPTYDSTNDLYVYFQEMEIVNLRVHGRMGMIVANKWMRAGYGERLREFLCEPVSLWKSSTSATRRFFLTPTLSLASC